MKTFLYSGVILALILGGCSTAYQTGRTPDDVYYSPARERTGGYSSTDATQQETTVATSDQGSGNYVTYSDGDNPSYNYDYGYNDPYYGGSYHGNYYLNNYYSPFSYGWYPSLSLGFGFGYPWMDSYFSPWGLGSWYNPYSYWGGYPYWGGAYYPGYYYGKYYTYTPRPSNSYGPRMGMSSTTTRASGGANTGTYTTGSAPVRTFNTGTTGGVARPGNTYIHSPRRVFVAAPDERPVNVNSGNRSGGVFRIFRSNNNTYRPQPVNVERPVREFQPSRSFEPQRTESAPVMNSSPEPAPVRTFSPRSR